MKNLSLKSRSVFFAGLLVLLVVFITSVSVDAQTRKRKKKRTTKPVATTTVPITQPQGDASIVSRADDFQTENQTVVTEPVQTENQLNETPVVSQQTTIDELRERIKVLESTNKSDEKQKRLLLNLDILSRAETRAETLRKQLFDLVEKENAMRAKIEQLDSDLLPQNIERSVALQGSLRADEARAARQRTLENEKKNLQSLLTQLETNRATLEASVQKADQLVEKVRFKLEKEIDDALTVDGNNQ